MGVAIRVHLSIRAALFDFRKIQFIEAVRVRFDSLFTARLELNEIRW